MTIKNLIWGVLAVGLGGGLWWASQTQMLTPTQPTTQAQATTTARSSTTTGSAAGSSTSSASLSKDEQSMDKAADSINFDTDFSGSDLNSVN